jgi:hypothetical protein
MRIPRLELLSLDQPLDHRAHGSAAMESMTASGMAGITASPAR